MAIFSPHSATYLPVGSAIISLLALTTPVQAAALSQVSGSLNITFSDSPIEVETNTTTVASAISLDGFVEALPEAEATFTVEPQGLILTSIFTPVKGDGSRFFGLAGSEAFTSGLFFVDAQETFLFEFSGVLDLVAEVDDPTTELASALGGLGISLTSISNGSKVEEFFELFAFINTISEVEEPLFIGTDNFTFTVNTATKNEGSNKSSLVSFSGIYSKTFESPTELKLDSAFLFGESIAQSVPAPSVLWGLVSFCGLGLWQKCRKKMV